MTFLTSKWQKLSSIGPRLAGASEVKGTDTARGQIWAPAERREHALEMHSARLEIPRISQDRGYQATPWLPYCQNVSGVSQESRLRRSLGISLLHVNSWVKPQNQLVMTSQDIDEPLCQVAERHSQEASQVASDAGQGFPWDTVEKLFKMEVRNAAVNYIDSRHVQICSNMCRCSHQNPLTIRELPWVTFCRLDWRFERHQHAPAQQIPSNPCWGDWCDGGLWDPRPRHARQCDPSSSSKGSGADSVPDSEIMLWNLNHCYDVFCYDLLWNLRMGILWSIVSESEPIWVDTCRDVHGSRDSQNFGTGPGWAFFFKFDCIYRTCNLEGHFSTPQSMTHRLSKLSLTANHGASPTAYTIFHIHRHTLLHTPSFIAHHLSLTSFTYNSLTVRSYTISFVFASFPCPLYLLF